MKLLDLFCGAGGAAMGYHRAGFTDIVGVDIVPQPNYPFTFIQGDALQPPVRLEDFDLIHASPPCQRFTAMRTMPTAHEHPDLLTPTREMLNGLDCIIENVEGAPMPMGIRLCGSSFGLVSSDGYQLRRHRQCRQNAPRQRMESLTLLRLVLMDIDWMTWEEAKEAIPPAYTEYLSRQFLDQMART